MARQAKGTGNWVMTAARFVPIGGVEPEEAEEEEAEPANLSLDARLEKAAAEPDYEHQETFRYLKEHRKQKRLKQKFERQEQARETMRAEVDRILWEDAKRFREGEATSGGVMAGVGISYIEDKNGKLIKQRRAPARRFTQQDRERADKNRVRYTRVSWRKRLLAIAEGDETVTKEQFQAFVLYGRCRGWHRHPPYQR